MAQKRTLTQKSFLLPSPGSDSALHLNGNNNSNGYDNSKKRNLSILFHAINDLHLSSTDSSNAAHQNKEISRHDMNSITPSHSLLYVDVESDLFPDLVIKRTITIETNIPSQNLLSSLRKYVSNTFDERDTSTEDQNLFHHSKLWKFPNEIQINHLISLQQQTNNLLPSRYSSSSSHYQILDTIWKISKSTSASLTHRSYATILQEYLVLWQEALYSACNLYFDHSIPTITLIGSSPSSCRVILSQSLSSPHRYEAVISCCPRSLFLKLKEAGIEIKTLLQTSSSSPSLSSSEQLSLPISQLSEKILIITGLVSVRLFVDLFVSHSLSLHSVSSYHRIVENLPLILTSQYFLHSSLQVNSLDSYSPSSDDLVEDNQTPPSDLFDPLPRSSPNKIKRFQLTGLFSHSSVKLLCSILKKLTSQKQDPSPPSSSLVDPRVLRLRKQANDPNGTGFVRSDLLLDEADTASGIKLLNPFEITKSDPIDSSLPIAVLRSPRSPRLRLDQRSLQIPETPAGAAAVRSVRQQDFFHLKLLSLQSDHVFNYCLPPPEVTGQVTTDVEDKEQRGGSLMTDIHWPSHRPSSSLQCYEIETWNLISCRSRCIDYQMNRNSEEIILN
jgi:hypothetical protein